MDEYEDNRVFVGGLSWEMDDRGLESYFRKFGKVMEAKVMMDRDTGRPRGFGFVTFSDQRGMEEAIDKLHDRELDGRIVSVTKAQPKHWSGGKGGGYKDDYGGGSRGSYGGRTGGGGGREDCFNCGQPGHWARDCPTGSGGGKFARGSDRYTSRDRYGSGPAYSGRYNGRGDYGGDRTYDRYSSRDNGSDRGYDRYNDSYSRESRYADRDSGRDRYGSGGPASCCWWASRPLRSGLAAILRLARNLDTVNAVDNLLTSPSALQFTSVVLKPSEIILSGYMIAS
ncbi:hypothetical protein L7F22_059030 [Adiantum nelumboides]|nr:hypothetical protein [Adiantum nelumboides]